MGNLFAGVILAVLLMHTNALPPAFPSLPSKQQAPSQTGGQDPAPAQEPINSVTVSCSPDSLEIEIQADLFGVGTSIRSGDVRLGVDQEERCRAVSYKIIAGLMDCGTKHWMTPDALVYTNLLIYSPAPPAGGVVRMEEAVIPIECHYDRKYSLSSLALSPTWVPFVSTQTSVEKLNFDLHVMTPDWLYKRSSNVFYLGDDINIVASVRLGHHVGLRVFLGKCVATVTPDEHSSPSYVFVEDGCLLDSQLPDSRSQFLSRVQDDKLKLVLDAFRFHNEARAELYITCHVTAVPVNDAEAPNKACTFINGRWRSADGNDYLCGQCQTQNEEGHRREKQSSQFRPRGFGAPETQRLWRSGLYSEEEFNKKTKVGPILVLPTEAEPEPAVPIYGSVWLSGLHQPSGSINGEGTEMEDVIDNEVTENHDKGAGLDLLPSPGKDSQNTTETEDFLTSRGGDYDETSFPDFDDELQTELVEFQKNETAQEPSDVFTTPIYEMTTTALNDTDSDHSEDPKK